MKQLLSSYALDDVSDDLIFDNDQEVLSGSVKQLASTVGLAADAAAVAGDGLKPAPPRGPKPYADVPLPPPDKPLSWKTKLVRKCPLCVALLLVTGGTLGTARHCG